MPIKKELKDSEDWQRYTGVLLEDMNSKYDAILEYVKDVPDMKEDIVRILTWEDDIKLIPVMFEEIGKLRQDVEILKEAMRLVSKNSETIEQLIQRVETLEQQIDQLRAKQQ